jgi:biopolymer transport protein ExbB/TolQ
MFVWSKPKNTDGTIKKGQSSETGNKTKENKTKTQHNMSTKLNFLLTTTGIADLLGLMFASDLYI